MQAEVRGRLLRLALFALIALISACSSTPQQSDGGTTTAIPTAEPPSARGNPESYVVFGKRYHTVKTSSGYRERGVASWYGKKFHGRSTSSGETYDMYALTAAHKSLPLPTWAEVTNLRNGATVVVRINDRGPFVKNRLIDLSYAAARELGLIAAGTGLVEVRALEFAPSGQALPTTTSTVSASDGQPMVAVLSDGPPTAAEIAANEAPAAQTTHMADRLPAASAAQRPSDNLPATATVTTAVALVDPPVTATPIAPPALPVATDNPRVNESPNLVTPAELAKLADLERRAAQPMADVPAVAGGTAAGGIPAGANLAAAESDALNLTVAQAVDPAVELTMDTGLHSSEPRTSAVNELFLQVGAFSAQENAERLRDRLFQFGFDNAGVQTDFHAEQPLFRVRLGPLLDTAELDRLVDLLRGLDIHDAMRAGDGR